jgi:hypothetical protein
MKKKNFSIKKPRSPSRPLILGKTSTDHGNRSISTEFKLVMNGTSTIKPITSMFRQFIHLSSHSPSISIDNPPPKVVQGYKVSMPPHSQLKSYSP